jgi:integrase/recombinase XerD
VQTDAGATDARILEMWLHGRSSENTCSAYRSDVGSFLAFVGRPLRTVTLSDLQSFADTLTGSPATRARRLSAVKSLLTFAARIGATPVNVGAALRLPARTNRLAERILSESDTHKLLAAAEGNARNHALLRLLYGTGLRVSEACELRWGNLQAFQAGGVVTVLGKGAKTRTVRIPENTWRELIELRRDAEASDPVFADRTGRPLGRSSALYIVRSAARRAGLKAPVSPHFLRHANASHALERGCPIAVVRDTLGHSSLAITSRYVHARPNQSTGDFLAV